MDFYEMLVPQIEVLVTVGRTINLEKTARFGKFSKEYFDNTAICLIHPNDLKRLGMKEGNLKISTPAGSVVVKAIKNEFETSEGIIVIPSGPWANRLIDPEDFEKGQMWFEAKVKKAKEELSTLETLLKEFGGKL